MTGAPATVSERRQVVDLPPVPAPVITEYQLLCKTCVCCAAVTTADWTAADDVNAQVVAPAGSPVRIRPRAVVAMSAMRAIPPSRRPSKAGWAPNPRDTWPRIDRE